MLGAIETLLQRASNRSEASEARLTAFHDMMRMHAGLVGMSRDAIARSKDRIARLAIKRVHAFLDRPLAGEVAAAEEVDQNTMRRSSPGRRPDFGN